MGLRKPIIIILVITILGIIPLIASSMDVLSQPVRNNTVADISIDSLVPDPDFSEIPAVVTNGTSEEYTSTYHSSSGLGDKNYLNLTFNHIANTSLNFKTAESDIYPDCNDFIYTYQDMEWTGTERPIDAKISIEYRPFCTGNFTYYQYDHYVSMYIWIVDSSQNWIKVGDSPYFSGWNELQTRTSDFTYFELLDVFDGMIDYGGGQEDPSDTLKLVIGISPTLDFYGIGEEGPWSYLNGSLTIQLFNLRFEVVSGDVDYEYDAYPSVGFGHWGGEYSVRYPDMAIGDDDSTYVIGQVSDYETQTSRHCLVEFNPLGAVLWSRSIDGIVGEAVAVRGSDIYTVGWSGSSQARNVALMKWNIAGNKIWNKTFDIGGEDYGKELAICTDGSVIIAGDRWREDPRDGTVVDAFLMKTDSEGEVLWTTIHENTGFGYYEVFVDNDDRIFVRGMYYPGLSEWNQNGNFTGEVYSDRISTLAMANDYFIVSDSYYQQGLFNISKVSKDGTVLWTTTTGKQYNDLWFEWIQTDGITVSSEENVYVIAKHFRFEYRWVLYKFDSSGTQEWNRSILDIKWRNLQSNIYGEVDLEMGNNDLLYIGGHWIPDEETPTAIAIAVYNPEGVAVPLIIPLWVVAGGGGVGIIIVIAIIYKKKQM
ncbi:MAG: hypothetical protein ACFFDD_06125 [Promethearchaeota archaeon]